MRWLLICLVVSVVALLVAAGGLARHIWLQRRALSGRDAGATSPDAEGRKPVEEIDIELER